MKKSVLGVLSASFVLLHGGAAVAACSSTNVAGIYAAAGTYITAGTAPFYCPSFRVIATATPNKYSVVGSCKLDLSSSFIAVTLGGTATATVAPNCKVTGTFTLQLGAGTPEIATIRHGNANNPVGSAKVTHGQIVANIGDNEGMVVLNLVR